jgi:hypothetical protein
MYVIMRNKKYLKETYLKRQGGYAHEWTYFMREATKIKSSEMFIFIDMKISKSRFVEIIYENEWRLCTS